MHEEAGPGIWHRPWWLLAFAWWTLDAVTMASRYHFSGTDWREVLPASLASAYLWVPLTVFALWLSQRYTLDRESWRRHLPILLTAALGVVLARALAIYTLNPVMGWYDTPPPFRDVLLTSVTVNYALFWLQIGIGHALAYARRARAREHQLARAELHALKMQLQPHFLFNTLHAISTYVSADPALAERMIARLSELLRTTLDTAGVQEVTLKEEIGFLEPYLELEQIRFEDRLRVLWSIDPGVRVARVPHLILQPLVENAIRHGIAPRAKPGTIEISACRQDGHLRLAVTDDGLGTIFEPNGKGVGLANTRARLKQLYGDRHSFHFGPAETGGVRVEISIPFEAADPQWRS